MQHFVDWFIFWFIVKYRIYTLECGNSSIRFRKFLVVWGYSLGNANCIFRHCKQICNLQLLTLLILMYYIVWFKSMIGLIKEVKGLSIIYFIELHLRQKFTYSLHATFYI